MGPRPRSYVIATVDDAGISPQPRNRRPIGLSSARVTARSGLGPRQLDELGTVTAPDQVTASGRLGAGPQAAEQRPLLPVARHQQPRGVQLAQPLQDRLEKPPGRPTPPAGPHQVPTPVPGLPDQ